MKIIKTCLFFYGIITLLIHGFSLIFDIKHITIRTSSFNFSLEDNISGIYFGLFLIISVLLFDILEKYSIEKSRKQKKKQYLD